MTLPLPWLIIIPGSPRTKKNHGRRTRSGKQIPSAAFEAWNKMAQFYLRIWCSHNFISDPASVPVNCAAVFYRDREIGDAVGYYQALADALQEARIVVDDRLIVSWDGSRMKKDARSPRIEVTLTEAH